jgi:3-oxoadipate enol-lactonase
MPTAPVNGTEIYYETHGNGYPLVFVHGGFGGLGTGAGGATPAWVERFTKQFQVILYDRRSSGRSGFPETPHSMEQFAGDIRGLLVHLGHERAHVWGTSAGGPITMEFGLQHPDAATSLVITESAPYLSRDADLLGKLRERISIMETKGGDAAYESRREGGTVGLNLFAAQRPAANAEEQAQRDARRAAIQAQLGQVPRDERIAKYASELRTYSAYADWNATDRLGDLEMPVLVVYGTGDTVFPEVGWDKLVESHANFEYVPVDGAEHGAAMASPKSLNAIEEFLLRNTPAA